MPNSKMRISVIGNCQVRPIGECLSVMLPDNSIEIGFTRDFRNGERKLDDLVKSSDLVIVQDKNISTVKTILDENQSISPELIVIPTVFFSGFHPDLIYTRVNKKAIPNAMGTYHSSIVAYAWKNGLKKDDIKTLFNDRVYNDLGFFEYYDVACKQLLDESSALGFDFSEDIATWKRGGAFMFSVNHPRLTVMGSFARAIVAAIGMTPALNFPEQFLFDRLSMDLIWPVYPEIADHLGLQGEYVFKLGQKIDRERPHAMDLDQFITAALKAYEGFSPETVSSVRFEDPRYARLLNHVGRQTAGRKTRRFSNPYLGLPNHQFWSKAVAAPDYDKLDPVVDARTKITKKTKIATAGSCFAQHIARALKTSGFHFYVTENGAELSDEEAQARQFGIYSARYGNIYTAAQLEQLMRRVKGEIKPADVAWARPDGRFVDPFRPQIEPDGFETIAALEDDRTRHFAAVRTLFATLDVFVFTLGLTEAWRAKGDKIVFPVAPGVAGGQMDFDAYEFHNYTVEETVASARYFIEELRKINPRCKIILTVSPVPLIATYENKHVLVSTTYSKSVLRVAADVLSRTMSGVEYFPSYEIITGNYNRGRYFEEDLRSVTPAGVAHVMGRFLAHYTTNEPASPARAGSAAATAQREFEEGQAIVCEEELLDRK